MNDSPCQCEANHGVAGRCKAPATRVAVLLRNGTPYTHEARCCSGCMPRVREQLNEIARGSGDTFRDGEGGPLVPAVWTIDERKLFR